MQSGRWEWRTFFATPLPLALRERFGIRSPAPGGSLDTYILSLMSPHNVKVRNGRLEIKHLDEVDRGLERWHTTRESTFPVDAQAIHDVFEAWAVPAPVVIARRLAADEFLRTVVRTVPSLAIVNVTKRRTRLELGGCAGEYASLDVEGRPWHTLAFEDADPTRVLDAIAELGLGPRVNTSYPAGLKRITGLTATPVLATEEGIC